MDAEEKISLELVNSTEKSLTLRKEDVDSILFKGRAQSGAEFLAARSYTGLTTDHDDSRPRSFVVGRTGRAAGYDHEM